MRRSVKLIVAVSILVREEVNKTDSGSLHSEMPLQKLRDGLWGLW